MDESRAPWLGLTHVAKGSDSPNFGWFGLDPHVRGSSLLTGDAGPPPPSLKTVNQATLSWWFGLFGDLNPWFL